MSDISSREKGLLLLLCVLVMSLSSLIVLILPRLEVNKNLKEDFQIIEDQVIEMDAIINQAPLTKVDLELLSTQIMGALNKISNPLIPDYFSEKLNDMAQKTGVTIHELTMQDEPASFVEVTYPELNLGNYELYDEILTFAQAKQEPSETLYSDHEIALQSISIHFDGGSSELSSFIHQIYENQKTIYIKTLNYDYSTEKGSMNLDLYSLEKPEKG